MINAPIWMHLPGTPLTIPGTPRQTERLPGMSHWAPRPMIERLGSGFNQGVPVDDLIQQETERDLSGSIARGSIAGGIGGTLTGRLLSGEAGVAPFKNVLSKGVSGTSLRALRNIPLAMKLSPLLGTGIGAAIGAAKWHTGKAKRRDLAQQTANGLFRERVMQYHGLHDAMTKTPDIRNIIERGPSHGA